MWEGGRHACSHYINFQASSSWPLLSLWMRRWTKDGQHKLLDDPSFALEDEREWWLNPTLNSFESGEACAWIPNLFMSKEDRVWGNLALSLSLSLKPLCEIRLWECTLPTLFIATSQPKPGTKIPPTSTSKGDTWMLACSNITTRMDWAHRDVHELSLYHLSLSTTFLHPCKPLPSVAHALQLKHLSFGPICAQASWMHAMDTRERRWYHEIINYSKVVQRLWLRGFRDII